MNKDLLTTINAVISAYFDENPSTHWIPVKKIMPSLVAAGIFNKDEKKGLPLRKILRQLDNNLKLELIPTAHAERNENTVYWYLVREGEKYEPKEAIPVITKKQQRLLDIKNSDEYYLVDLCDEILGEEASRKHIFDSIVGNLHKHGKGRTKLPVDAYYKNLKLVIEFYKDRSETQEEPSEKEQARVAQITYYDELKKKRILKMELRLLKIKFSRFELNDTGKLIRNTEEDIAVLKNILQEFV